MLKLKNITKVYEMGDMRVEALKNVSIDFRKSEFVAVLGPSGCGKTTMLNIVGGLDRYTEGDLMINNISTKKYKDVDWDIYRNNSIGFVFQTYNLIPHQTALANVELALTLAGISKGERRRRAIETLEAVGLHDQLYKKPGQMSGGQMQRVSIARALVNNPEILLADEPTGALDSETSVQIMEILKEISKDRLVIMVTHNPDIAGKYSNRIIRLLDGRVTDDTNPYTVEEEDAGKPKKRKKISMSFSTALSLSLNNLLTKKTRTILTAFAGSIGIIGIALIMSLSSGMQNYINTLEQDTLSVYPITLQSQSMDIAAMMGSHEQGDFRERAEREPDRVYALNIMTHTIQQLSSLISRNDLARFKLYIEEDEQGRRMYDLTNSIQYGYGIELQLYKADTSEGVFQVNPSDFIASLAQYGFTPGNDMGMGMGMGFGVAETAFTELLTGSGELINETLLHSQYDLIAGSWPQSYDEVVLVVSERNGVLDFHLYALGLLDLDELEDMLTAMFNGDDVEEQERASFSFDEMLGLTFKLVVNTDYFVRDDEGWADMRDDEAFMLELVGNAPDIRVAGIVRPNEDAMAASINGSIGYTHALTEYVIGMVLESEIAKAQLAGPDTDVFTGTPFEAEAPTMEEVVMQYADTLPEEERMPFLQSVGGMSEEELYQLFGDQLTAAATRATYDRNREILGIVDFDTPSSISLYPKDFASKEEISALIERYNEGQRDAGAEENVIRYTDFVAMITSGMTDLINIASWVLIAFVSISLIVSSIMIAIITYISVLERTKEIGILRSIGAAKRDISRVFNAETLIEGFTAGVMGVGVTLLLNIPVNIIIKNYTDITGLSQLPVLGAFGLVLLSMFLTVVAGFIPSKMAAKKDPVVALRAE